MSGQIENLLRVMVNGDKEAVITAVAVTPIPSLFTSQLVQGFPRKAIWAYNNSHINSGECYYGYVSGITPIMYSRPIPVGAVVEIPVTTNIPLYFRSASGELGDIRIEEIA
jgi:hypothetical protein